MQSLPATGSIVWEYFIFHIIVAAVFSLKRTWFLHHWCGHQIGKTYNPVDYKDCSKQLRYQRTGWVKKNHTLAFSVQRVVDSSHCSRESVGWRVNVVELRRRRVNSRLSRMIFALRLTTSARRRYNYSPPLRACNGILSRWNKTLSAWKIVFHTWMRRDWSFGNGNKCEH